MVVQGMHRVNVHSHDVVCDNVCFGGVFRRGVSLQTAWVLVDLGSECMWTDMIFTQRFIHLVLE